MTPVGVFVSDRDNSHKKARYGNKLAANNVDAKSAEFSVSPLTDHAFAMDVTIDEVIIGSLINISGFAPSASLWTDVAMLGHLVPMFKSLPADGDERKHVKV